MALEVDSLSLPLCLGLYMLLWFVCLSSKHGTEQFQCRINRNRSCICCRKLIAKSCKTKYYLDPNKRQNCFGAMESRALKVTSLGRRTETYQILFLLQGGFIRPLPEAMESFCQSVLAMLS